MEPSKPQLHRQPIRRSQEFSAADAAAGSKLRSVRTPGDTDQRSDIDIISTISSSTLGSRGVPLRLSRPQPLLERSREGSLSDAGSIWLCLASPGCLTADRNWFKLRRCVFIILSRTRSTITPVSRFSLLFFYYVAT